MGSEQPSIPLKRGEVLYTPSEAHVANSRLTAFARYVQSSRGVPISDYASLHAWSCAELGSFWAAIAEFFDVRFSKQSEGPRLSSQELPGAHWFNGCELNYAAQALRHEHGTALIYRDESNVRQEFSYAELRAKVARCRTGLRALGVGRGDAVVAYLGNTPEAVIALLATASLGAIWSSCPPEFGAASVLDRFQQIGPKVLIATDAYDYNGQRHTRAAELASLRAGLPHLEHTVLVDRQGGGQGDLSFDQLLQNDGPLLFESVPFEHPLWVLYSSGTTGQPKAIVHGHGGITLEHLKVLVLHSDLSAEDRFFWYSTTGWMMWNYLVSGLLLGCSIVLYEGSPGYPDLAALWSLIDSEQISYFGTSAPFIMACHSRGLLPKEQLRLNSLRAIGSTGAPLPKEGFHWIYDNVKSDVHLGSVSGGTDVCTAFLLSCPWLPVRAGELQCAALGAQVIAANEHGQAVVGELGELVIERPLPSMPLFFWNDPQGARLKASYFARFAGKWCHGDWLCQFEDGASVVFGRSDATLNRAGVRMGSSEFYRVVENLPFVRDSLVVDTSSLDQPGKLWLFVVLSENSTPHSEALNLIKSAVRQKLSPRHIPDVICFVPEIPYTLSGKKLEVPVKRLLSGTALSEVCNPGTLRNPEALGVLLAVANSHS